MKPEDIVKLAAQVGAEKGVEEYKKQLEQDAKKKEQDKKLEAKKRNDEYLYNTKLLFKNYRKFKRHIEHSISNIQQAISADEIKCAIELLEKDMDIKAIRASVSLTYIVLSHMEKQRKLYQAECEASDDPRDQRQYRVFHATYIDDKKMTRQQICEAENIDDATYYRDINACCEELGPLIFGFLRMMKTLKNISIA